MADCRQHERVPCRLRCWCEADHVAIYARTGNLSEGGVFLRTSTPFEEGARTTLRLESGGGAIVATAEVRWARSEGQGGPPGMGLSFEALDERARAAIRHLIEVHRGN